MMHKHEQTETLVAQATTRFCRLRVITQRTVVQSVENLAAEPAVMTIKGFTQDLTRLQAIPVINQLLPTLLQHSADIGRNSAAIDNCLEVSEQMSPAELMAMIFQMAAGRIAIADNDAIEFFTEQISGHGPRPRSAHGKERAEATHDRPQPGLASVLAPAGFVHVYCGRISDIHYDFVIPGLHCLASDALQTADLAVGDLQTKQILQQRGDDPLAASAKAAEQRDHRHYIWPEAAARNKRWQSPAAATTALRTFQRMNLIFSDGRSDRWNLSHLMTLGIRVSPAQPGAAGTARRRTGMFEVPQKW